MTDRPSSTPPRDLPTRDLPHDDPFQPFLDGAFDDEPGDGWTEDLHRAAPFLAGTAPLLIGGVAALVLGTFLGQVWVVLDDGGEGLAETAAWFVWGGRAAVAVALVAAAVRPSPASGALRLGMVAVALLFLVGLGGVLAGLAGRPML